MAIKSKPNAGYWTRYIFRDFSNTQKIVTLVSNKQNQNIINNFT